MDSGYGVSLWEIVRMEGWASFNITSEMGIVCIVRSPTRLRASESLFWATRSAILFPVPCSVLGELKRSSWCALMCLREIL